MFRCRCSSTAYLAGLMLLACENQYSFDEVKSAEDSGSVLTEVVDGEVCEALNETNHAAGECWIYSSTPRVGITDLGDRSAIQTQIDKVTVSSGDAGSVFPGTSPVKFGRERLDTADVLWTEAREASGTTGSWSADWTGPQRLDINDVPASQEWLPMVHIADPSASESVCAAYAPVEVCVAGSSTVANRTAPDDAECEAGSGRFALQPVQLTDHDEDGNVTVAFQALQTTGTGALTGLAWITEIAPVETQGAALRVMKVNQVLKVSPNDLIENATTRSFGIPSTGATFSVGNVSGSTAFLAVEIDGDLPANLSVDLEWECGSGQEQSGPTGYRLDDQSFDDCAVEFAQQFVIRPNFVSGEPTNFRLMPYGIQGSWVTVPVDEVGNAHVWEYDQLGFHASGTLDSWDAEELTLTLDSLTWEETELCESGTYTLSASE